MSAVVPLAVGEILVPKPGSAWTYNYTQVKVLAVTEKNGRKYYWLEMSPKGGSSTFFDSLREDSMRSGWQRKPKFFQIGKTYKFKSGARADKWMVMDLYLTDNPVHSANKAVAWMVTSTGERDLQTLSQSDFERMVEA